MITRRRAVLLVLLAVELTACSALVTDYGWGAAGWALTLALAHGVEQRHYR